MKRYLLHLSYNGTHFHGWQRQNNVISVQESIEKVLSTLSRTQIVVNGCGRTDKGVHARSFYAHFDIDTLPDNCLYKLNKMLSEDIAIYSLKNVDIKFHTRFAAKSRTYKYYFHIIEDPFIAEISSFYNIENIDLELMQEVTDMLIANEYFGCYCKVPEKHNSLVCKIFKASLTDLGMGRFVFELTANRFLRGMIRILMYDLLLIGQGKLSLADFKLRLEGAPRKEAVQFAYPQGLFLEEVEY